MDYTVELYKLDRRQREGRYLVMKVDLSDVTLDQVERMYPVQPRYVREIHKTYVTRRNLITGQDYQERYDTPHCCSAASETYWSM